MAIEQDAIDAVDGAILTQASTSVKKLTDAMGNSFENVSIKEQIEAREMLNKILVKSKRTSMFDKFKFGRKWSVK